jgi:uncharacterized membrane protein
VLDSAFGWLKYVHILLAIVAVGFNASYGIWLARAARDPQHELWALRVIKTLDDRFANPAYGLLLATGLVMVWIGWPRITDLWIILALILYAVLVVLGAAGYTPTLRKQIAVLEAEGPGSAAYRRLASRGRALGITLAIIVIAIVFLMVMKPTL